MKLLQAWENPTQMSCIQSMWEASLPICQFAHPQFLSSLPPLVSQSLLLEMRGGDKEETRGERSRGNKHLTKQDSLAFTSCHFQKAIVKWHVVFIFHSFIFHFIHFIFFIFIPVTWALHWQLIYLLLIQPTMLAWCNINNIKINYAVRANSEGQKRHFQSPALTHGCMGPHHTNWHE